LLAGTLQQLEPHRQPLVAGDGSFPNGFWRQRRSRQDRNVVEPPLDRRRLHQLLETAVPEQNGVAVVEQDERFGRM
jgi:hypothetical protein